MNRRQNFFHTGSMITHAVLLGALLLVATSKASASNEELDSTRPATQFTTGSIVVTLKPLYSLVSHLTKGITHPTLLIEQIPSSHHYSMRPSERRLLAKAKMIIWFGPTMETFLSKVILQQINATPANTIVVTAMQAEQLKLLNRRGRHSHGNEQSNRHMTDPHIWLSTHNAAAISKHISSSLISYDPANAEAYKKNLQRLLRKIEQTKNLITTILGSDISTGHPPFITYHDAFQYFEDENRLNYIDSISYDEETGPSLKQLRKIRTKITEKNIQCLVYQSPKPAIVESLSTQTSIKTTALDPLGINVSDNKNAWFILMQQLATDFKQCLKQ